MRANTPVSSLTSRIAQSAGVSPPSTCPFGRTHSDGLFLARTKRYWRLFPDWRTTTPPAWVTLRFLVSLSITLFMPFLLWSPSQIIRLQSKNEPVGLLGRFEPLVHVTPQGQE